MKYVDPLEFSKFIRNDLPKEKMIEVEKALLKNGTANATFLALIDEYESRSDVEDIIGKDDENCDIWADSEKKIDEVCKKMNAGGSFEINDKIQRNMNNLKISQEDMAKVAGRYQSVNSSYDSSKNLSENLKAAYKAACPTASDEEATLIVEKLLKGCDELTIKYHQALADGFDAEAEISNLTKGMETEDRYRFLINALSAVEALNIASFPSQTSIKEAVEAAVKEYAEATPNPTDADCEAIQKLLAEALTNNTLVLAGSEKAQELLHSAKETNTVVDFASEQYDDARMKAEMALAMWLEYEDGNISSIETGASPEAIGIGAATAVEEAKVMNDVATGKTTADIAIKCLKILGGVALFLMLGYLGIMGAAIVGAYAAGGLISLFGTSIVSCVASLIICLPLMWGMAQAGVAVGSFIMDKAGQAFDFVVEKLRESVFPKVKEVATRFINWIKGKLGQVQGTSTDTTVAMV